MRTRLAPGRRDRRPARGQSAVEFALVLPLFIILVVGILEGGRVIYAIATLDYAVKQGGRFAALPHSSQVSGAGGAANSAEVQSFISSRAAGLGVGAVTVSGPTFKSSPAPAGGYDTMANRKSGERIVVSASYTYQPVIPWLFAHAPLALTRRAEFMVE